LLPLGGPGAGPSAGRRTCVVGEARHCGRQRYLQRVALDHQHRRLGEVAVLGRSERCTAPRGAATPSGAERPLPVRLGKAGLRGPDSVGPDDGERGCVRAPHVRKTRLDVPRRQFLARALCPVPADYQSLMAAHLDASVQDMAYLYAAYARDRKNGTFEASTFKDALKQHHLIDQIEQTSAAFFN
jgi:hypothetical protein